MNSWIFSDNDQTTEPLSGQLALDYVVKHPNAYAWRPSFTHWMPVTYIAEFSNLVSAPKAPATVPQELIESFLVKEKSLIENLGALDSKIVNAINSLSEFDAEVNYYKELTEGCNLEVQETLNNIEQQYARLKANLKNFTQTASSDKKTFSNTVDDFKSSTSMSSRNASESSPTPSVTETIAEPAKSEPDPVVTPTVVDEKINETTISEKKQQPDVVITESDTVSIDDESMPIETKPTPTLNVVPKRVVAKSDRVASSTANKAAASLSELVSDAPVESVSKPVKSKKHARVEFSEDITAEDIAIAAKIQSMTVDAEMASSYDKHNMVDNAEGDFDYILKGKYVDDGSIGARVDDQESTEDEIESEDEELVTDLDDEPKKRKRRRRR